MKRKLEIHNDLLAVRGFNNADHTMILMKPNVQQRLLWMDREENRWKITEVTWDGGKKLKCIDDELEWESDIEELKTEARPLSDHAFPGESD